MDLMNNIVIVPKRRRYCLIQGLLSLIIATIADLALGLKVSKFQNEIMKLLFLPKYEAKIVRIFALSFFLFVSASCLLGSLTCLRMITAKKTESKIGK